jgi:hypothetical protein
MADLLLANSIELIELTYQSVPIGTSRINGTNYLVTQVIVVDSCEELCY